MDQSLDQFIRDRNIRPFKRGNAKGTGFNKGRSNNTKQNNRGQNFQRQQNNQYRQKFQYRGPGFQGRGQFQLGRGRYQRNFQQRSLGDFRRNFGSYQQNRTQAGRGRSFSQQGMFNRNTRGAGQFFRRNFGNNFGLRAGGGVEKRFTNNTGSVSNTPVKLYISNLDFGVSNQDIKELFGEFGPLRRYGVNFGQGGQSLGTAEVQYLNRSHAVRAHQKYNNVTLDGRPMKLEVTGSAIAPKAPNRVGLGITKRLVQRSRNMMHATIKPRGASGRKQSGNMKGKGNVQNARGPKANKGKKKEQPTVAQLDADLEAYATNKD